MFEEAENLDTHPYFRTKHESERVVREECSRPWRVYRPGSSSATPNRRDRQDRRPLLLLQADAAPPRRAAALAADGRGRGREINLVPVDFVAKAIDHIAHQPGLDGKAFSLTDPQPEERRQVINLFSRSAQRAADVDAARPEVLDR